MIPPLFWLFLVLIASAALIVWILAYRLPHALRAVDQLQKVLDGACGECQVTDRILLKELDKHFPKNAAEDCEPKLHITQDAAVCYIPSLDEAQGPQVIDLLCVAKRET